MILVIPGPRLKPQQHEKQETEEIKKRWQEYKEEVYKKGLNDLDKHDGMVTHTSWSMKSSEP